MLNPRFEHFERAALEISEHGDNDTLPFDIDTKFCGEKSTELATIAYNFFNELKNGQLKENRTRIAELNIFSERLIAPSGPAGFRVVTKIQMFWSIYFNGLGIAIAEALEQQRDPRSHSYRFLRDGQTQLFSPDRTWRTFKQKTVEIAGEMSNDSVVVQTDISGFYDCLSHHHIENFIFDLGGCGEVVSKQINALLSKFSAGRSFGLPVGGQGSRVLAELFLKYIDNAMSSAEINWHRYVDDYILIAPTHAQAYNALSTLAHSLSNYGLNLNKSKTVFLSAKHYVEYVMSQLGEDDDEASKLRSIDIKFDPYSDTADEDYENLKETVDSLDVRQLLNRELEKSLPDTFLVTQIGRTLRLHAPNVAYQIAATLLSQDNMNAFRSSWSTIMRGIANLRKDERFASISDDLDSLLDQVPIRAAHLLEVDTSLLHYLRCLRFKSNPIRGALIRRIYDRTYSQTVKLACIDCWRQWEDRNAFTDMRNRWAALGPDSQRLVWLASYVFNDQGRGMRDQLRRNTDFAWQLGVESDSAIRRNEPRFPALFRDWAESS